MKGLKKMGIQESGEMYLETILRLSEEKGSVRSIDVSESMGYSKPSVSRAVGILKSEGYLTVEKDGTLTLTESGKAVATKVYERHTVISSFLISLGVSEDIASADACKIEHIISDETFEKIKKAFK